MQNLNHISQVWKTFFSQRMPTQELLLHFNLGYIDVLVAYMVTAGQATKISQVRILVMQTFYLIIQELSGLLREKPDKLYLPSILRQNIIKHFQLLHSFEYKIDKKKDVGRKPTRNIS